MGFKLRREVRDLLPKGLLTDKEARLILELADNCDDDTREGWPGVEWLADKADIPNSKRVGEFFASIAKKWVELRVPLGVIKSGPKSGQSFYSHAGERTTYRFPSRSDLEARSPLKVPAKRGPSKVPPTAGPKVPAEGGPKGPPNAEKRSPQRRDPSPHITPQRDSSSLSSGADRLSAPAPLVSDEQERDESFSQKPEPLDPRRRLIAKRGFVGDEIDFVQGFIESANRIDTDGWYFTADRNGSLDNWCAQARKAMERGTGAGDTPCLRCNGTGKHLADTMYGTTEVDCQCQWQATERCPIHMGNKALACAGCWGDVKSGMDPYRGRERERPGGWYDVYHRDRQPRSGQRGTGVYRNPANQDEYDEWLRRPGPQVHMDPPERSRGIVGAVASELLAAHGINRDQEGPT